MLGSEKNRWLFERLVGTVSRASGAAAAGRQGQFQGQQQGQTLPRKSMLVVYLAFSRGEVAERLKAAVC
jgi:hypothetical protein